MDWGKAALGLGRCGWGSWRLWSKSPPTSGVSAAHGGVRLSSEAWAGWRDLVPGPGQDKYTVCGHPPWAPVSIPMTSGGDCRERPILSFPDSPAPAQRVNLIIDIQERMARARPGL